MGLVQEGARKRLAGVFRREMNQPPSAAVTEEGQIISKGPLIIGRAIFDATATEPLAEPAPAVPLEDQLDAKVLQAPVTAWEEPPQLLTLVDTKGRKPYGRGKRRVSPSTPRPPSAVGNGGLAKVVNAEEFKEPELREKITLEGVEARVDETRGKPVKKRGGELSEKQRREIVGKIPQIGDEELKKARAWNRQTIERYMKRLSNQRDVVYNKSKALATIALFIAQASRRSLEKFDPELENLMEFQVKRALGVCLLFIVNHREIGDLARLFEVTKGAVGRDPFYFWKNEKRD